jgi:predicted DCC family thiol-disulfide oxidoreductase YuxK
MSNSIPFRIECYTYRYKSLPVGLIRKLARPGTSTSSDKLSMENKLAKQTGQDVVIYDGECVFCTSGIKMLARLDSNSRLRFVSLHDPVVATDYPDLTYEQLMEQMWVVSANGQKSGGADAIAYLSTRLPMLYPLAPIIRFPGTMPLWRTLYRLVARLRYRIAGKQCDNGSCSLHHR